MTDSTKVLDALEAAEKAATPGPWTESTAWPYRLLRSDGTAIGEVPFKPNRVLIHDLRNAAPALIAVARAAKELRDIHAAGFGRSVAAYRGLDDLSAALADLGEVAL